MRVRWESLLGKALIIGAWLLFAQIVWVGVEAGMNAERAGAGDQPVSKEAAQTP